jgi:hypothetical protein
MLLTFKRFLLARKTVLSLIILLLLLIFSGVLVPQRLLYGPVKMGEWWKNHTALLSFVKTLGLDHVFTSPLFFTILLLFLLSVSLSAWTQIQLAVRKTRSVGHPPGKLTELSGITADKLLHNIRRQGYNFQRSSEKQYRLVKHPWGLWGNAFLHCGMVIVIIGSMIIALTQQRGRINLTVEERFLAGSPLPYQENGLLAKNFILPFAIRIDAVKPQFFENDYTKDLISNLTLFGPGEETTSHVVGINRIVNHDGIRIYQKQRFGNSFYMLLNDSKGEGKKIRLDIPYPKNKDKPAYGDFLFAEIPFQIKAKYFADSTKQSMYDLDPVLTLRLINNNKVVDELSLRLGQEGQLGPYRAQLLRITRWTSLICVRLYGIPLVFLGFFFIILGAFLVYCTPSREFHVTLQDDRLFVGWLPGRFADLYRDEFDQVMHSNVMTRTDNG